MQYRILYDYAINSGRHYEMHCRMARRGTSPRLWELHVRINLLPDYRREFREPYEGMTTAELALCAKELEAYYRQHLAESDGQ